MSDLTSLPEIGPVAAGRLTAVGIQDAQTLRSVGAREAFLRIRQRDDPGACIQMLVGLESAVRGVRARDLPPTAKSELRQWLHALEA